MSNKSIELERTFLARYLPEVISNTTPTIMEDTYFPEDPALHPRLRVRRKNSKYEITKKVPVNPADASIQVETTIPLEDVEYQALIVASKRRVSKNRYKVCIDGHSAEIDVFLGHLEGLVLVDFEFESEADMDIFTIPDYCLAEVTQEHFVAGGLLAGKSYTDIESELDRLGYHRIDH